MVQVHVPQGVEVRVLFWAPRYFLTNHLKSYIFPEYQRFDGVFAAFRHAISFTFPLKSYIILAIRYSIFTARITAWRRSGNAGSHGKLLSPRMVSGNPPLSTQKQKQ